MTYHPCRPLSVTVIFTESVDSTHSMLNELLNFTDRVTGGWRGNNTDPDVAGAPPSVLDAPVKNTTPVLLVNDTCASVGSPFDASRVHVMTVTPLRWTTWRSRVPLVSCCTYWSALKPLMSYCAIAGAPAE